MAAKLGTPARILLGLIFFVFGLNGFLNFTLSIKFIDKNVIDSLSSEQNFAKCQPNNQKILLEYISANKTEVLILNATGETVLKTNNYQNNWPDGPLDFKNVNPVYYYIITTVEGKVKKGSITVVK